MNMRNQQNICIKNQQTNYKIRQKSQHQNQQLVEKLAHQQNLLKANSLDNINNKSFKIPKQNGYHIELIDQNNKIYQEQLYQIQKKQINQLSGDEDQKQNTLTNNNSIDDVILSNFTSIQKVKFYFEILLSHKLQFIKNQIINLIQSITVKNNQNISKLQNKKISILQKSKIQILQKQKISRETYKILQVLSNYHSSQIQQIQNQILKNKIFKKCSNFSSDLIIHEIYPSKNYQMVVLDVQLGNYKTLIKILNLQDKQSPLHKNAPISGTGSFGNVYFVNFQFEYYAIKSIKIKQKYLQQINQNKQNQKWFIQVLKQYFLLLLFSELQVGPKVRKIVGFDLVLSQNCIQFSTEICQKINYQKFKKQQLKQSLRKMHVIKVMHQDIKPDSIMYSPTFKKLVFIDFGGCLIINQPFGVKTLTNYFGTTAFCSQQMNQRLRKGNGFVDLYFNDVYGLYKTFIWQQNSYKLNIINHKLKYQELPNIRNANVTIMKFKYFLYTNQQNKLFQYWKSIKYMQYQNEEQNIQQISEKGKQFKYLNPTNLICSFYINKIKNMATFQDLKSCFINNQTQQIFSSIILVQKSKIIHQIRHFYKKISIIYNKINNPLERQISYIKVDRLIATQYLQKHLNLQKQLQGQISRQNLIILSIIILDFCTFNHNKIQQKLQYKIQICEQFISIISLGFPQLKSSLNQVFQCKIQSLKCVAIFCNFFIKQIWRSVPQNHKQITMYDSISTLCILGYPAHINHAHKYLMSHFIHEQERILNILYYWRSYLFILCFNKLCYAKQKNQFKLVQAPEVIQSRISYQEKLMKILIENKQNKQNTSQNTQNTLQNVYDTKITQNVNVFQLQNYLIYKTLNSKDLFFQIKNDQKLHRYEKLLWKQSFQIGHIQFNKWKQTLRLIFLYYKQDIIKYQKKDFKQYIRTQYSIQGKNVYYIQNKKLYQIQNQYLSSNINQYQRIWKMELFQFMAIQLKLYYHFSKDQQIQSLLNIYDTNINNQQITNRHFINYRLAICVKNQQNKRFELLSKMLILQMETLSAQSAYLFYLCLKSIRNLLNFDKNSQIISFQTLRDCYIFVDAGISLSRNYLLSLDKRVNFIKQVKLALKIYILCLNQTIFLANTIYYYISRIKGNGYSQNQLITQKFHLKYRIQQMAEILNRQKFYFDIIYEDISLKNVLLYIQVEIIPEPKYEAFIKKFEFYFPNFDINQALQYNFNGVEPFFIFFYIVSNFNLSMFNSYWQIFIKRYYYYLVLLEQYSEIFHNYLLDFSLNSLLQTITEIDKYKEIHLYFEILTDFLKRTQHKHSIKTFFDFLCKRIKFMCKDFANLLPNYCQKFNPQQLINDISNNIITKSPDQNCYMAFIYAYCLNNKSFTKRIQTKLLGFIYKSMHFLTEQARCLISTFLYIFFNRNSIFVKKYNPLSQIYNYQLSQPKISTYLQKYGEQIKNNRKDQYFIKKLCKCDQCCLSLNQTVIYKFKLKRWSIRNWAIPPAIGTIYKRKITKYHQLKHNYAAQLDQG